MQPAKFRYLILFLIFFSSQLVCSQLLAFRKLSIEDGLSNNFVRTIHKDKEGYMWFGTLDGLDRFDGVEIVSYKDLFGGEKQSVNSLIDGPDHKMWIGTEKGLFRWNLTTSLIRSVDLKEQNVAVKKLLQLPGDTVLFAGTSKGGYLVDCNSLEIRKVLNDFYITDAVSDSAGHIWLATLKGLVEFDYLTGEWKVYRNNYGTGALYNAFSSIALVKKQIVAGTQSKGLYIFSLEDSFKPFGNIGNNYILSLNSHDDGRLFIGTDGGGLVIAEVDKGVVNTLAHDISNPLSLNSNAVYSFLVDEKGRYWIGTYSGGVNFSTGTAGNFKVSILEQDVFIGQKNIRSLYFSKNGDKFIGTRDGLIIIEKTGKSHFFNATEHTHLRSNIILSFYPIGEDILIGTYGGGISKYNKSIKKIEVFRTEEDFLSGAIYGFDQDKQGNLWISSLNGIYCINSRTREISHFSSDNTDLPDNRIYAIRFDSGNRLWLGTMNGTAVFSAVNGRLNRLSAKVVLPKFKTVHFYEDHLNNMWIATEQGGLFCVSANLDQLSRFTEDDGLPDNSVSAVTETAHGFFWISTLKGLCRFDKEKLLINTFSLSDGLPGLMFNPGALVHQTHPENLLWFGNEQGLVHFSPDKVFEQRTPEKVIISDLYLSGRPVVPGVNGLINKPLSQLNKLVLKGNQNNIGFRFIALNYFLPADNLYLYRLKYIETDWKSTGTINRVFFQGLRPGKYILEVCLAKGNGQPDMDSLSSLEIEIKPLFFQNPAVLSLSVLILFFLFIFFLRMILLLKKKVKDVQFSDKEKESQKYEASRLSPERSKELLMQLISFTEESKIYLDADLKIGDLAERLSCSYHDLSQVINQCLSQSFSEFINHYRIEEVKRRLTDEAYARYTLLAVAESCGFSSKTSFYRVFKKETGVTPAEYIQGISKKST